MFKDLHLSFGYDIEPFRGISIPKNKLIGLFVVAGWGSAISGYLDVWSIWFGGLGVYRFVGWNKLCFQSKSFHISRKDKYKDIAQGVEVREYDIEKAVEGKERAREGELEHQVDMLRRNVQCSGRYQETLNN